MIPKIREHRPWPGLGPGPYFEGKFDEVFEMVYEACTSFLENLEKKPNID